MKTFLYTIFAVFLICTSTRAQIKEVKPTHVNLLDFTAKGEKDYNKRMVLSKALVDRVNNEGIKYNELSEEEKELYSFYIELDSNYYAASDYENIWESCTGPQKISASSHLGKHYIPNIHDLDFSTAWVVAPKGDGVGEYITFHFEACTPRVSLVSIANGNVKSQTLWEKSRRIKKLMMYVNNEPYAILLLEDSRSEQFFEFPHIGNNCQQNREDAKDWTMKFEILETYESKKNSHATLSEIYFDGNADVRCFAKGTPVNMADGTTKPIEELVVGDEVKVYDLEGYAKSNATVEQLEKVVHTNMVKYTFANGKEITATPDHPFMVSSKGWSSSDPEQTKQYKGFGEVNSIRLGDGFLTINEEGTITTVRLTKIEYLREKQETYTISKLSTGINFLVSGFIVGVEEL